MTDHYPRLIYGDILRISLLNIHPRIITLERSFLGLNYVSIHCHVVISEDSRFQLLKQLRPDNFRFTDRRFLNGVRINGVNLSQGGIKLGSS